MGRGMNENHPQPNDQSMSDDDLLDLIVRYHDDALDEFEVAALSAALEGDDRALEIFHHVGLQALTIAEVTPAQLKPSTKSRSRFRWWGIGLALAASVVIAAFVGTMAAQPQAVAKLVEVHGTVTLATPGGDSRELSVGDSIPPDTRLSIRSVGSSATLEFPDRTRVRLFDTSEISCREEDQKEIHVYSGNVVADVQPQPPGRPLIMITQQSVTEVLGTVLAIQASPSRTDVDVVEGTVRVNRTGDRSTVDVSAGQKTTVSRDVPLKSHRREPTPIAWGCDFEDGLPTDWRRGILVQDRLPSGSHHGVLAEARSGYTDPSTIWYEIETYNRWSEGLFTVTEDARMKLRLRADQSRWVQVVLLTRSTDFQGPEGIFEYVMSDYDRTRSGDWQTFDIPLSDFKRTVKSPDIGYKESPVNPPKTGDVAFKVVISTQDRDLGTIVDELYFGPESSP